MALDSATKALLTEAVRRGAYDPAYWLRFFLRKWYPKPFPPFHLGMIALLTRKVEFLNDYPEAHDFLLNDFHFMADPTDPTAEPEPVFVQDDAGRICMRVGDNNNWMIPRGFSKTTICNGCNLYDLVTDGSIFLVYISASSPHAETQLGNIKFELEDNELLREAYGNLVPDRSDSERWSAKEIQLTHGAIMMARGRGGQVRGLNFRARRPNHIVLDDVEDEESVKSPTVREATGNWFYSAVVPSGALMDGADEADDTYQAPLRVTNLGTLLGAESLNMTLAKDIEFNTVKLGACVMRERMEDVWDEETKTNVPRLMPYRYSMLWPYKMTAATYDRTRERYRRLGKLGEFTREYDSSIRISDDTIFPSIFIYQPTKLADLVQRSMAMDPAISEQPGRDSTAIVVAGRRASDGALWMLDEWGGLGKTPREKIDMFFDMHLRWQTTHNGIEAVQYQKALIFLMKEEMARRKYFFYIKPILQGKKTSKDDRIVGILSPRYVNGYIRHLKPLPGLEGNLADWPNGKKDFADAAAMAFSLLGESQMLALPEGETSQPEYPPQETALPPLWQSVNNYYVNGGPDANRRAQRYPVRSN